MAEQYRTDKAGWYTPFYSLLFEPRRMDIKRVLEVGIGTKEAMAHVPDYQPGASLFMWRDFFPNAIIYGVDVESSILCDERIVSIHSDSRDLSLAGKLPSDLDLIIDDGAHDLAIQWKTFLNLFPLLRDGGFYIIEDAEEGRALSELLEGHNHQIVLSPHAGSMGKLILIQK